MFSLFYLRRITDCLRTATLITLVGGVLTIASAVFAQNAQPDAAQRSGGATIYIDDVQNAQIQELREGQRELRLAVQSIDSKITWGITYTLGAIGGIYLLLTVLGRLNLRVLTNAGVQINRTSDADAGDTIIPTVTRHRRGRAE